MAPKQAEPKIELHFMARDSTKAGPPLGALLRVSGIIAIAGALGSCGSGQQLGSWAVTPESACSSFSAGFPLDSETLRSIVGPNFAPSEFGEARFGQLQITVHNCSQSIVSGTTAADSAFAVAAVPLATENASITLAGLDADDWASLVLYVGPSSGRLSRFMRSSAFAAVEGESSLSLQPERGRERITADIGFDTGRLSISAVFACVAVPFRRTRVLVGTGSERFSLMFGDTAGTQCSSSDVAVELIGETPFSDLDLAADGANASWATGVIWNYRRLRNAEF